MFCASGGFRNFVRVNAGHPLDARALAAIEQVGALAREPR